MTTVYLVAQRALCVPRKFVRSPDGEPIKVVAFIGSGSHSVEKLATDAIGTFTLVLKNVVVGSRYRIERAGDGSLATPTGTAEGVVPGSSGTADVSLTLDLYPVGSANNDLRIKVRKASATPFYRPFESLASAQAGAVTVFVSQALDE